MGMDPSMMGGMGAPGGMPPGGPPMGASMGAPPPPMMPLPVKKRNRKGRNTKPRAHKRKLK